MPDKKHNNIPTLDEVVQPGSSKSKTPAKKTSTAKEKEEKDERRTDDRRQKQTTPSDEKPERRTCSRRSIDQRREKEINELVKKIMHDMMPDLEQHMSIQLRFELQKYLPKMLSEFKDGDKD